MMQKLWKKTVCLMTVCVMLAVSPTCAVPAAEDQTEPETEPKRALEGQLTMEDLAQLNGGLEKVYTHNDHVTLVGGTCTPDPVTGMEDASAVVDSMVTLMGGDADTEFVPWRQVTDPMGDIYYIFQQIYHGTTVCGGAVKVVTDADCNMIGMSCSVESSMPEAGTGEGITAREAEQIVLERVRRTDGRAPEILDQYTDRVILPTVLEFDIENEDQSTRFVWMVYTDNPSGSVQTGSDLPYLVHYVSMSGDYLYNLEAIVPDDETGRSGFDASYIFEFMEPAEYTGYVDLSDGTEKEITVTVMRDRRTGMYYLGNLERRIVVAECYDFLYGGGQVVLESSKDNLEWDQVGLLSLYNYCRAWDYYNEIGWTGGDGEGTPIIILNNFCDDHYNEVNNACYVGKIYGMQVFLASKINDLSQCLDVIAHEFTHCVTGSLMTYNSYQNDYGAINEAMSDIQGKNCEMMAGDVDPDNWVMGANSATPVRSMSDPRSFQQPAFTWDEYYVANAKVPGTSNDHGGVHFNSSLLNQIAWMLVDEGGMTFDEARTFWFMMDCMMVPGTDYEQIAEILPWVLKAAGMEQYDEILEKAIRLTRLNDKSMPEHMDEEHAMIRLSLPDTEAFDSGNWMLLVTSVELEDLIGYGKELLEQLLDSDYSFLPEEVQEFIRKEQEREMARASEDPVEVFLTELINNLEKQAKKEEEPQTGEPAADDVKDTIKRELAQWLKKELSAYIFSFYGFAGQDGSTLNMVVRPGRTIPILQHATHREGSDQPDQVAVAVYIGGKWYGGNLDELMEAVQDGDFSDEKPWLSDLPKQILSDLLGENLENLDLPALMENPESVLDLFTVNIKGGEVLKLSSEGLDQIVVPEPTPPSEKPYGTIQPGRMSRPKLDPAMETEAETQDEAA